MVLRSVRRRPNVAHVSDRTGQAGSGSGLRRLPTVPFDFSVTECEAVCESQFPAVHEDHPTRAWEVVFKTALVAPRLQRQLRTHGYNHARRWLDERPIPASAAMTMPTVVRACEAAMRRMPLHFSCLDRSLILWWLLGGDERAGIVLGVAPPSDHRSPPLFHAWVEVDGVVVNDAPDVAATYRPFVAVDALRPENFS